MIYQSLPVVCQENLECQRCSSDLLWKIHQQRCPARFFLADWQLHSSCPTSASHRRLPPPTEPAAPCPVAPRRQCPGTRCTTQRRTWSPSRRSWGHFWTPHWSPQAPAAGGWERSLTTRSWGLSGWTWGSFRKRTRRSRHMASPMCSLIGAAGCRRVPCMVPLCRFLVFW